MIGERSVVNKFHAEKYRVVSNFLTEIEIKRAGVKLDRPVEMRFNQAFDELRRYREIELKRTLGVGLNNEERIFLMQIHMGAL